MANSSAFLNSTEANLSSGSTIVVKVSVDNGTTNAPTYVKESFTGETDNLTLVPPPCLYGGASPAMEFMETNAASPVATCFSSGLQAFTTLASFDGTDGELPDAAPVQATDGNLYGTTWNGGASDLGTVFKTTPAGTLTTLYNFCRQSGCADGANPVAGLVQAANGDFYGTTSYGGTTNKGTVFRITPSGTLTTLHSFCSLSGCTDGSLPYAGLVQATNGNLYGTTQGGGAHNGGTVFKVTPSGALTTLYSFCRESGCGDGDWPEAGLVQATNGDFYGTTYFGGAGGDGTVFKITPTGTPTTLYSFCSQGAHPVCTDGGMPTAGLVQAADGNFYGTTEYGGASACEYGCGTIFKITPNGTLTTLHSLCSQTNCTDGEYPFAGLVQATNGDLYGATTAGGANGGYGMVFGLYVGLAPFVGTQPTSGEVGAAVKILGTNLTGATSVTFNGAAAAFTVVSPSLITTTVRPPARSR